MKKNRIWIAFCIFLLFLGCSKYKSENVQYKNKTDSILLTENIINKINDIKLNLSDITLARIIDSDMEQNHTLYNNDEIKPILSIEDIFKKPFLNSEFYILSEYSDKRLFELSELFNLLNLRISQDEYNNIISIKHYENIKISFGNYNVVIYKEYDTMFKLFFFEYFENTIFEPIIKIWLDKLQIINILGNPTAYSYIQNIMIYLDSSFRQINIFFDNSDKVKIIQLISWGGI